MEQAPEARARNQDEAGENATLKTEFPHHRVKAVGEPARVKAGDQARAPVEAAAKVAEKAAAGGINKSTIQQINDNRRR